MYFMAETHNLAAAEAANMEKESYLDSKTFQAANRVYQLESQGTSVSEALLKDRELNALVVKAFEDKKWNPEGKTIEQTKFSQPDAAKSFKFGKPMTSWTDNPVSRMWKNETPNAEAVLREMQEKDPDATPEKSETGKPKKEKSPAVSPEESKKAKEERENRAEQDVEQSQVDAAKLLDQWMEKEEKEPGAKNLSEGGKQEGFARGTRREGRAGFGGTIEQTNVDLPGTNFANLGAAGREADARGAQDVVHNMEKKSWWARAKESLIGSSADAVKKSQKDSHNTEAVPFTKKESADDSETKKAA